MSLDEAAWVRATRELREARRRLVAAEHEEQWQAVGLLCREALISCAQAVFDPSCHGSGDDVEISRTDARRMLDSYFDATVSGPSNAEIRTYAKAAVKLAVALQHKRTAGRRDAALCISATTTVLKTLSILSDLPDPSAPTIPWRGVEVHGRYVAWDGPTLHALDDRPGVPATEQIIIAIKDAGCNASFGRRDRLREHLARGLSQVYETDRETWRRELLYDADGSQVLLVRDPSLDGAA